MAGEVEGVSQVVLNIGKVLSGTTKQLQGLITEESRYMQSYVRTQHLTGGTTDTRLAVRSGRLRGSCIPIPTTVKEDTVEGGISFGTVYARVHIGPKGQVTTIKPKGHPYLAIPLPGAKTPAGVAKGTPKAGPWGDTFIAKSKRGNLLIFGKLQITKGKRAGELRERIIPLFLLLKSVRIKARVHPEDIFDHMRPKIIQDALAQGVKIE